jgi:cell division septum initiation protein DivIVA
MDSENLKLLERRIDDFLATHEKVREERDSLEQRLKEAENRFARLSGTVKQLEKQRNEMRSRLERILSRLGALDLG